MPGGSIWREFLKTWKKPEWFPNQHKTVLHKTSLEIAEAVDYDVLIEMTPLDMNEGQVATEHIMAALKRGQACHLRQQGTAGMALQGADGTG